MISTDPDLCSIIPFPALNYPNLFRNPGKYKYKPKPGKMNNEKLKVKNEK